ncbi:MAG: alpha-1,2-fucosyltransferase [Phycisphaerales bacterium]|nr:alpha-1,2-fucosyltransferase [Phycisphaerales bacterium]
MRPVTIAATGGLGNQLFQLAAAVAVAEATGRGIEVCTRMYDRPAARRAFLAVRRWVRGLWTDADGRFRLDAMARGPELLAVQRHARGTDATEDRARGFTRASLKQASRDPACTIPGAHILRTRGDVQSLLDGRTTVPPDETPLVSGFMQTDAFVAPRIDALRAMIELPRETPYAARWIRAARERATVGMHVRRGDYAKPAYRDLFPIVPAAWYAQAAELLRARLGDVRFLVVTDDPGWVRAHLKLPGAVDVASGEHPSTGLEDLAVLAACGHHIIANSTFGWWGARLATGGGLVVAPTCWLLREPPDPDLLPASWLRLENPRTRD